MLFIHLEYLLFLAEIGTFYTGADADNRKEPPNPQAPVEIPLRNLPEKGIVEPALKQDQVSDATD